jgi:hypothetical protein
VRRRLGSLIVTMVFWGMLLSPAIAYLAGVRAEPIENRSLVGWPGWGPDFFSRLSVFLQDQLPMRARAIRLNNWLEFTFLHESPSDQVIVGNGGWLFYALDFGSACSPPADFDAALAGMRQLDQLLRSHGKTLRVVIAPDKSAVYRDQWSWAMGWQTNAACIDARRARARELSSISDPGPLVDLWTPLQQSRAKLGDGVYLRYDTHWTDLDMVVGVRQVIRSLDPHLWRDADIVSVGEDEHFGDLTTLMDLPATEHVKRLGARARPRTARPRGCLALAPAVSKRWARAASRR